jgi:hypothetical protein
MNTPNQPTRPQEDEELAEIGCLASLAEAMASGDARVMCRWNPGQWSPDLPAFGGEEPKCKLGVWSWDEENILVGTCADDLAIVPRDEAGRGAR